MTQVCRTCLEEITDVSFLPLSDASNRVKDELTACIPELDLSLVPQAAVCVYCASALHAAYDFKQKCLETEQKIRSHMQGTAPLDLEQIKQEVEVDSKFQVVHGPGIGMEVIYIQDDEDMNVTSNDDELIISDVLEPAPSAFQVEPVKLFLNVKHDLSSQGLTGGFSSPINTHNSLGQAHSMSIKKRKYIKKEPTSYVNADDVYIPKSYDCPHCSFSANRAYYLKMHMKSHDVVKSRDAPPLHAVNGENIFKCTLCDYSSNSKMKLASHTRTHTGTPFICPNCDYQSLYKVALHNHMRLHNNAAGTSIEKKEAKTYKCKQCPFHSLQKQAWLQHLETHTVKKNLKCSLCSHVASDLAAYQRHLNTHPAKKPFKIAFKGDVDFEASLQFKCPSCPYTSPNKHRLAAHILVHTGEKPYECNLCKYRANQKGHIDKHMQNHSGDRAFKCDKCSYSVNKQYHLAQHMKVHDEEPPVGEGDASAAL